MSPNRRIFLNIAATYGRSLYALIIGLFTARWVLMTLGKSDYGLYGVVGGLTAFIAFINSIMAVSVGRYYAYAVGRAKVSGCERNGLEECRQWFNTAVVFHSVLPVVLMVVGYPIGEWAIRDFLVIPPERIEKFVWIFRFTCVNCFWGMISVPFNAMYTAKQYIAELTVYSFVTTTLNFIFLSYMVNHPGDWLVRYGLWNCLLGIVPAVIITVRAYFVFPECRFNLGYMRSLSHLKELGGYAGWYAFGMTGNLFRYQCLPILVNKYFGPIQNAAVSVAKSLASHTTTLSGSLVGAFSPAITNALGAGNTAEAVKLLHRTCKFGTLLVLPFCIPLSIEVSEVMRLWLKNPPEASPVLAIGIMVSLVLEKLTTGHWVAISGNGKMALYQFLIGINFMLSVPICWGMFACGMTVYAVAYSLIIVMIGAVIIRIWLLKRYLGVSSKYWTLRVFTPILVSTAVTWVIGRIPSLFWEPSFLRVILTTIVSELVLLPLVWWYVLDSNERLVLLDKASTALSRFKKGN